MKTFRIEFYKTDGLTPDEQNAKRKNAKGVWLYADTLERMPRRDLAIKAARQLQFDGCMIGKGFKIRAIEI